jgi:hypothetical protein
MIKTEKINYEVLKSNLEILNWFHPNRITYHINRIYMKNQIKGPILMEYLYLRYIFSYCKLFVIYTLNFMKIWRLENEETFKRIVLL